MTNTVNVVIKIAPQVKKRFYDLCKSLGLTPMRTILILIERFASGKIDALPILEDFKQFKATEKSNKVKRILKYRVSGTEAYKINKERKEEE